MKTFVFPYYISFGKNDSISAEIEFALSDKNAKRLIKSAQTGGRFHLDEDEDIGDIYDKVYDAIIKHEKTELRRDPTPVKDALSWSNSDDPDKEITEEQIDRYIDELFFGINYPAELQSLEPTITKRKKQSQYESITVNNEEADTYIRDNQDKIVYIDNGRTLYFIPSNYSGKFVVTSMVRSFKHEVFRKRNKITEIVIEDGVPEIPDWTFAQCENVEHISVPPSVKKIGFNAFTKCYRLYLVNLSEGLVEVHYTAFRFCDDLKGLRIPASVKEIDASITAYNNGIRELYFEGMETNIKGVWNQRDKIILHVKKGSVAEQYATEIADVQFHRRIAL